MSFAAKVSRIIEKYGTRVILREGDCETSSTAVIQPLMYKNKMYVGSDVAPLGFVDKGHYLMIAPCDFPVKDYSRLLIFDGNKGYTVKRSETVKLKDEELYIWAVLTVHETFREDEYESA